MSANEDESFERLRFEHELINRRLTWLLTSQSILFAAYGFALNKAAPAGTKGFLKTIAISGAVIAFLILIGVIAGILAKRRVWKESNRKEFGVRTWITYMALVPDTLIPIVFIIAWIYLFSKLS